MEVELSNNAFPASNVLLNTCVLAMIKAEGIGISWYAVYFLLDANLLIQEVSGFRTCTTPSTTDGYELSLTEQSTMPIYFPNRDIL